MKMDKKWMAIIVMGIIILGVVGVFAYNYVSVKAYDQGFRDSNIFTTSQIKNNLEQYGFITYMYPLNETSSIPIKLAVLRE